MGKNGVTRNEHGGWNYKDYWFFKDVEHDRYIIYMMWNGAALYVEEMPRHATFNECLEEVKEMDYCRMKTNEMVDYEYRLNQAEIERTRGFTL